MRILRHNVIHLNYINVKTFRYVLFPQKVCLCQKCSIVAGCVAPSNVFAHNCSSNAKKKYFSKIMTVLRIADTIKIISNNKSQAKLLPDVW